MLTIEDVKNNPRILECIKESDNALEILGYTEHGLRHLSLVSDRARAVAKDIGLSPREQELSAIAGFCHDMGNFMGRNQHHYWGGLLFYQIFGMQMDPQEATMITQAIANHDKEEMKFSNPLSAAVVLADKSDVHRSRVRKQPLSETLKDVHDRVNYGVLESGLHVEQEARRIVLTLSIDTDFVPVMEFFEIFTERMSYCRKAAEYFGYHFGILANDFKIL
jgi:metal-dependent HD superfamily phosphatase/phosphodiesterase